MASLVEAQRPDLVPVDRAALQAAFTAFGHQPQFFMAAMGAVLSPLSSHSGRFEPALQQAQKALEALRHRTPALVWKSTHGEYAVEGAAMHRWYERRVAAGRWPPAAS